MRALRREDAELILPLAIPAGEATTSGEATAPLVDALHAVANRCGWRTVAVPPLADQLGAQRVLAAYDAPRDAAGAAELVADGELTWLALRGALRCDADLMRSKLPVLTAAAARTVLDAHAVAAGLVSGNAATPDASAVPGSAVVPSAGSPGVSIHGLLRAAALLNDVSLAAAIAPFHRHSDPLVVAAARDALLALLPDLHRTGEAALSAWLDRHAQDSSRAARDVALLSWFVPASTRRQDLRRALVRACEFSPGSASLRSADPSAALSDPVADLVARIGDALRDPDPELQLTALIAIVRCRLRQFGPELSSWRPAGDLPAAIRAEHRAVGRGCLAEFLATPWPQPRGESDFAARLAAWQTLRDAVAGRPCERGPAARLVRTLTTPQPDPHVAEGFAAIPALPHWVGPDDALREVTPCGAIAVLPWRCDDARVLAPCEHPGSADAGLVPASDLNDVHSQLSARGLRLPTPDEAECALRGLDARRYPAGEVLGRDPRTAPSAWGLHRHDLPMWTIDSDGTPWLCGGRDEPGAVRRRAVADDRAALRPWRDA